MKKTYKKILAVIALAAAGAAHADPVTSTSAVNLITDGGAGYSAGISKNHSTAGDFIDVFKLTGLQGLLQVDGFLKTAGSGLMDINFSSIAINGYQFDLNKVTKNGYVGFSEMAGLSQIDLNGPLVLTVTGHAGGAGIEDGAVVFTSYSCTINAMDVPEPASLALVGAALAAAGFVRRRRNSQPSA